MRSKNRAILVPSAAILAFAIFARLLTLPIPAHAAPPDQSGDPCSLLPSGGQVQRRGNECITAFQYSASAYLGVSVSQYSSPAEAQRAFSSRPQQGNGISVQSVSGLGDEGYQYAGSLIGNGYTFRQGCFVGGTIGTVSFASLRQAAAQLSQRIASAPCGSGGGSQPTSPPVASGPFTTSGGCGYTQPKGNSRGYVECAAVSSGKRPDAEIEYHWYLDGAEQGERRNTFTRTDDQLTPGAHTITIVAFDVKNGLRAIGTDFKFTSSSPTAPFGATSPTTVAVAPTFSVSVGCSTTGKYVQCSATPNGVPDGADLDYTWYVDGSKRDSGSRTFLDPSISDGPHVVSVYVIDNNSGKSASGVDSVFVGKPSDIASNVASWMTGNPDPGPVDVAKAAGAGAAVTILLGIGEVFRRTMDNAFSPKSPGTGSTKPPNLPGQPTDETQLPETTKDGIPLTPNELMGDSNSFNGIVGGVMKTASDSASRTGAAPVKPEEIRGTGGSFKPQTLPGQSKSKMDEASDNADFIKSMLTPEKQKDPPPSPSANIKPASSSDSKSKPLEKTLMDGLEQQALRDELIALLRRKSDASADVDELKDAAFRSNYASTDPKKLEEAEKADRAAHYALEKFKSDHPGVFEALIRESRERRGG